MVTIAAAKPAGAAGPTIAPSGPWVFHPHFGALIAVGMLGAGYALAVRRRARVDGRAALPTRRQLGWLAGGLGTLLVALSWPVADLAAHWSLTALLVQRILLTLAVAPMLLLAMPTHLLAALTRPAPVDRALDWFTRPAVAIVTFSVIVVGTLFTPAVAAAAVSTPARALIDALLLVGGMILWAPVLSHIPGAHHPAAVGLAAYLFVQSILPSFPAVIYVFARHPLYPAFAASHLAIGLSALNDQQLAGVLAKVATLPVLWIVAWVILNRAERARNEGGDEDTRTLTWAEVERHLERAERAERRNARHHSNADGRPGP
ncbi:MAG TPA: cytochrome c oxidase assembly protein [Acidimicrobiales bacterium]|nr:cytochrome c oxidase assembly protein [Acidimicrobiales bacterium]